MLHRAASPTLPRLHLAARTKRGPTHRDNEDNYAIVDLAGETLEGLDSFAGVRSIGAGILLAVFDAMGGQGAGAWAAKIAVRGLCAALGDGPPAGVDARTTWLGEVLAATARAIWDEGTRLCRPDRSGMGAVATLALVVEGTLHLAHVGDTRCYLLREGRLVQLTRDDTLGNDPGLAGLPAEELAQIKAQYRNVITNALGMKAVVTPRTEAIPLRAGDVLLLASDGLHGAIEDAVIAETLRALGDAGEAALALESLAERAASDDDVTVLVARVEGLTM